MFSSRGLFKNVRCPNLYDCTLPACWFLHEDSATPVGTPAQEYDPFSAGVPDSPPAKRRKLLHDDNGLTGDGGASTSATNTSGERVFDAKLSSEPGQPLVVEHMKPLHTTLPDSGEAISSRTQLRTSTRPVSPPPTQKVTKDNTQPKATKSEGSDQQQKPQGDAKQENGKAASQSLHRPISPPATKTKPQNGTQTQSTNAKPVQPAKQEALVPRSLGPGPAKVGSRINFLKALHTQIKTRNSEVFSTGAKYKSARLTEQEMIRLALDEEEVIAKKHDTGIYQNIVRQRAHAIKTMKLEDWAALLPEKVVRVRLLQEKLAKESIANSQQATAPKKRATGMPPKEELAVLRKLRQPLEPLEQYGYVTKKPGEAEVAKAKEALISSDNWEQCERCTSRFQVFPGRDDDGRLASGGKCHYHWARANRQPQSKMQRATGISEEKYACCNRPYGSEGCTEAENHVFNVKDRNRLASLWQWEETPDNEGTTPPLSFDCEMCYTTLGMEVVRVTAVSWPMNEPVLDVLVRPYGEILDLNTKFSGVTRKAYAEAPAYDSSSSRDARQDTQVLQKVGSPADARQLLFDLIAPTTPLIGHAIDNDLNTLRIIHPFVIDTVLLYPHRLGLPKRMNLRGLARDYLGRTIQSGDGHDSKEDAIATGDLVSRMVKNHRVTLRNAGWRLENGEYIQGEGNSKL
jgi:DNA polymerase III epsilon subunit-like protein